MVHSLNGKKSLRLQESEHWSGPVKLEMNRLWPQLMEQIYIIIFYLLYFLYFCFLAKLTTHSVHISATLTNTQLHAPTHILLGNLGLSAFQEEAGIKNVQIATNYSSY